MSNLPRDPPRLRQGLNPLLTSSLAVSGFQNQVGTPISAVSSHQYSTNQTPLSAIQPYNPQEWVASPAIGPDRTHQQFAGGPEPSPPPPPPYSPPRSSRPVSQLYETPSANTSVPRMPPTNTHHPSPDPPTNAPNPVFPPPPPSGGRGASRERRFLPSFGRRREQPESATHPEPHPPVPISRPTPHGHVPQLSIQIPADAQVIPPAARRAVSTPAVATPTSARSRSSSQVRWDPGMPVPPPPPGPPPSQSRSQSVSRTMEIPTMVAPPTRRPPPSGVSNLGPVPPTPADWVDSDRPSQQQPQQQPQARRSSPSHGLSVDTSSVSSNSIQGQDSLTSAASSSTPSGGLGRSMALRGEKSLRQRRAESKSRHVSHGSIDGAFDGQLSDIVVPSGQGLTRRLTIGRNTPRSAKFSQQDTQQKKNEQGDQQTPRAVAGSVPNSARHPETPTSPFSPHPQREYSMEPSPSIAPKALPTPPPQNRSSSQARGGKSRSNSSENPQSPRLVMKQVVVSQSAEQFCQATIDRYQSFAHREMTASSDAERVRLFAEFIVNESRIRRERYSQAIGAMGSEIFDLTRDLFRPMTLRRDSMASQTAVEFAANMPDSARSTNRNPLNGVAGPSGTNLAPPSAAIQESPMSTAGTGSSGNDPWPSGNGYIPSLSPILSMSVSEHPDDSSRGRPASRWWEDGSVGSSQRLERSKRESKYMGVPREAWHAEEAAEPSSYQQSTDYPPEKVGWHEASSDAATTPQPFRLSAASTSSPSPYTPNSSSHYGVANNPRALDVSRLVTLPPPYPRHHPAVNNNHPTLTSIRTKVRTLSDLSEAEATKERFLAASKTLRAEAAESATARKTNLRTNLQAEIGSGRMSYAEAASIEADSAQAERDACRDLEKTDFEMFQRDVVTPLHDLLTARVEQATALFDELRSRLFEENQTNTDPNMPQEEGDETPELLEKLTLLKWIFEAREALHKAVYDLLTDRNDRYKEMIITPYRLSNNEEKMRNVEAFFAEDGGNRAMAFAEESLKRTQEFRDVVEENVVRGVEVQLSAFWDLVPPLSRILDKIPPDVSSSVFAVQIPAQEYDENPSYRPHPLQYLYSLLLHAEKSTYQFIESQTNLLCLLHEVKEAVTTAKAKVMECEGRDPRRIAEATADDERRLDEDLKEKVRVVQDQWGDALGELFSAVKARVGEYLLSTGGWDEALEDGGVGEP